MRKILLVAGVVSAFVQAFGEYYGVRPHGNTSTAKTVI